MYTTILEKYVTLEVTGMPVFKNYSADGTLLEEFSEPLTESNIERFVTEYGEERTHIYLQALADFNEAIKGMIVISFSSGATMPQTPHMSRKMLTEFYNHNVKLLDVSKNFVRNNTAFPDISETM